MRCRVMPMRGSPCSTAQLIGARPRYFGSSEPCMLNAPERRQREDLRADHVPVINREDQVGLQRGDLLDPLRAC